MLPCNGADRGCVAYLRTTLPQPETEPTSRWCSNARPVVEPMKGARQMTAVQTAGAASLTAAGQRESAASLYRVGRVCFLNMTASSFSLGA
jgi:hypothetical protein